MTVKCEFKGNIQYRKDITGFCVHRANGPAKIFKGGHEIWFLNNEKHRYYGPGSNWTEYWYLRGVKIK